MKNEVGLWLDYKHAVMVINLDQVEEIKQIKSNMAASGVSQPNKVFASPEAPSADAVAKDLKDERQRYYDEIISYLRTADSILIFGPGKAKTELQKRLAIHGFDEQTVTVQTAKKMTDKQIIDDVHKYFRETQHGL